MTKLDFIIVFLSIALTNYLTYLLGSNYLGQNPNMLFSLTFYGILTIHIFVYNFIVKFLYEKSNSIFNQFIWLTYTFFWIFYFNKFYFRIDSFIGKNLWLLAIIIIPLILSVIYFTNKDKNIDEK